MIIETPVITLKNLYTILRKEYKIDVRKSKDKIIKELERKRKELKLKYKKEKGILKAITEARLKRLDNILSLMTKKPKRKTKYKNLEKKAFLLERMREDVNKIRREYKLKFKEEISERSIKSYLTRAKKRLESLKKEGILSKELFYSKYLKQIIKRNELSKDELKKLEKIRNEMKKKLPNRKFKIIVVKRSAKPVDIYKVEKHKRDILVIRRSALK
jgi:chemotaxis regulatin CheY-phosphate phosphatase CheZ